MVVILSQPQGDKDTIYLCDHNQDRFSCGSDKLQGENSLVPILR